jgi:hypothetical protein
MTDATLPAIASIAVAAAAFFATSLFQYRRAERHSRYAVERDESRWQNYLTYLQETQAVSIEIDVFPNYGILRITRVDQGQMETPISIDDLACISTNIVRSPFPILVQTRSRVSN